MMDLSLVEISDNKRIKHYALEQLLQDLPISVQGTKDLKLEAHVGILNVTYLIPIHGSVTHIDYALNKLKPIVHNEGEYFIFNYENHLFEINYQ